MKRNEPNLKCFASDRNEFFFLFGVNLSISPNGFWSNALCLIYMCSSQLKCFRAFSSARIPVLPGTIAWTMVALPESGCSLRVGIGNSFGSSAHSMMILRGKVCCLAKWICWISLPGPELVLLLVSWLLLVSGNEQGCFRVRSLVPGKQWRNEWMGALKLCREHSTTRSLPRRRNHYKKQETSNFRSRTRKKSLIILCSLSGKYLWNFNATLM